MKKILSIIVIFSTTLLMTSCQEITTNEVKEEKPQGNIFTYEGFYEGLELSAEEQKIVDNRILHISESYLAPTREYSLESYPFDGEKENEYINKYKNEIIKFLEEKFNERVNDLEIEIRDDRVFDYTQSEDKNGNIIGKLIYRYDVVKYRVHPYYNEISINVELLNSKVSSDEWDENILYPFHKDGWYSNFTIDQILRNHYGNEITKYYQDTVDEINDYFKSTGNYHNVKREEVCGYLIWSGLCNYIGAVSMHLDYSKKATDYAVEHGEFPADFMEGSELNNYFNDNKMSTQEIIDYINNSDYYTIGIFVEPYISKEVYDDNNLQNFSPDIGSVEHEKLMKKFTDKNLDWIIEDKNEVKKIIENSGIVYSKVWYTLGMGFIIDSHADEFNFGGLSNTWLIMRIYDGDYPWLSEDIIRENEFGEASQFEWEGGK